MSNSKEETYIIKPSTELIADEYEHFDRGGNAKIALHTFIEEKDEEGDVNTDNEKRFLNSLANCGFEFKNENHHSLHEVDFVNCMKKNGMVKNYDTPAEADILIIYNTKNPKGEDAFITDFCKNIDDFGDEENIVSLATISSAEPTLLISTMTRSFYFTRTASSDLRGHHQVIRKHADKIDENLREMQTFINAGSKKKKEKHSFLGSFRMKMMKKTEEQKETEKERAKKREKEKEMKKENERKEKENERKEKEKEGKEKDKKKQEEVGRIVPAKRPSGLSGQFRQRSRSQTESDSGKTAHRRPSDKNG
ncbi:unnamed protein product [Phyllotreta striolata]|uniref:Uncharacterized protein n=1 Tax=Phyllotreta striolata TaxID=444603 RepID=A0A9N9TKA7_PHYSR|nr:unnamed protein product [Phyllotreta striolata]